MTRGRSPDLRGLWPASSSAGANCLPPEPSTPLSRRPARRTAARGWTSTTHHRPCPTLPVRVVPPGALPPTRGLRHRVERWPEPVPPSHLPRAQDAARPVTAAQQPAWWAWPRAVHRSSRPSDLAGRRRPIPGWQTSCTPHRRHPAPTLRHAGVSHPAPSTSAPPRRRAPVVRRGDVWPARRRAVGRPAGSPGRARTTCSGTAGPGPAPVGGPATPGPPAASGHRRRSSRTRAAR